MSGPLIRLVDDEPPAQCRHCGRFLRPVAWAGEAGWLWVDSEDTARCMPAVEHEPMPDRADLRLAVAEALHPEEFGP
jgi:hypothetical protein